MMPDPDKLEELCRRFGARPPQDRLMARKLVERAEQLSRKRDMEPLQALQYLLSLMVNAREQDATPDSAPQKGLPNMPGEKNIDPGEENH